VQDVGHFGGVDPHVGDATIAAVLSSQCGPAREVPGPPHDARIGLTRVGKETKHRAGEAAPEVAGEVVGVEGLAALPPEPGTRKTSMMKWRKKMIGALSSSRAATRTEAAIEAERSAEATNVGRPEAEVDEPFRWRRGHEADRYWK
jgi:hypothetical protein